MKVISYSPKSGRAVARAAANSVPSLHAVFAIYFLSMGLLALALAINRA